MKAKTALRHRTDTRPAVDASHRSELGNGSSRVPADDDGTTNLEARFLDAKRHLSSSRQLLLNQILKEADETFFLSSREMGSRYGVDAATIVRTIQAMGYQKFADFSRDLRDHFVTQITPYTAIRAATQKSRSVADYVHQSVEKDLENLNELKGSLEIEKIIELAKQIHVTRRIIIVGIDFAASLAMSFAYGLIRLGCDAEAGRDQRLGPKQDQHHERKGPSRGDQLRKMPARDRRSGQASGTDAKFRPLALPTATKRLSHVIAISI